MIVHLPFSLFLKGISFSVCIHNLTYNLGSFSNRYSGTILILPTFFFSFFVDMASMLSKSEKKRLARMGREISNSPQSTIKDSQSKTLSPPMGDSPTTPLDQGVKRQRSKTPESDVSTVADDREIKRSNKENSSAVVIAAAKRLSNDKLNIQGIIPFEEFVSSRDLSAIQRNDYIDEAAKDNISFLLNLDQTKWEMYSNEIFFAALKEAVCDSVASTFAIEQRIRELQIRIDLNKGRLSLLPFKIRLEEILKQYPPLEAAHESKICKDIHIDLLKQTDGSPASVKFSLVIIDKVGEPPKIDDFIYRLGAAVDQSTAAVTARARLSIFRFVK